MHANLELKNVLHVKYPENINENTEVQCFIGCADGAVPDDRVITFIRKFMEVKQTR
jgi:hypothetical protein